MRVVFDEGEWVNHCDLKTGWRFCSTGGFKSAEGREGGGGVVMMTIPKKKWGIYTGTQTVSGASDGIV